MSGSPLTLEQRYTIYLCRLAGLSVAQIACGLGRHRSSVYAELARGADRAGRYCPHRAQALRQRACARSAANAPCLSPGQWRQVQAQLRAGLSPEQISGRRARCQPQDWQVSVQAIYNACVRYGWGRWLPWVRLRAHLRRPARKPYAGRAKPIDKRSRWANGRRQRGHYEADTMCGKRSDAKRVLVVVERTTLLTCLRLVPAANAQATASSVQRAVQQAHMPCGLRSVTTDRGVEFARLGDALPTKAYVCDAHRPNQRATNENQIGVLRRYLPKGQSLDNLSGSKLYRLQHKLNHTPRKCLGFLTPYEVAFQRPPHVAVRT